jgi:hypothetical protein
MVIGAPMYARSFRLPHTCVKKRQVTPRDGVVWRDRNSKAVAYERVVAESIVFAKVVDGEDGVGIVLKEAPATYRMAAGLVAAHKIAVLRNSVLEQDCLAKGSWCAPPDQSACARLALDHLEVVTDKGDKSAVTVEMDPKELGQVVKARVVHIFQEARMVKHSHSRVFV